MARSHKERNIALLILIAAAIGSAGYLGLFSVFGGNQFYAMTCSGTQGVNPTVNMGSPHLLFLDYDFSVYSYAELTKAGVRIFYDPAVPASSSARKHVCIFKDGSTALLDKSISCSPTDTRIEIWYYKQTGTNLNIALGEVYYYFKPDDLDFQYIQQPQTHYFQGENITVSYKVISKLDGAFNAVMTIRACTPVFFGQYCQDFTKSVQLQKGDNIMSFSVPANAVSSELTLQPIVTVVHPSFFTSSSLCFSQGGMMSLFAFTGSVSKALVIPKPIFLQKPITGCPIDYHDSPNGQYCISNELASLGCVQLGCPVITGHEYSCTSAGNCAELIYVYKDCRQIGCLPQNTTAGICNVNNGACEYTFIQPQPITCINNPVACSLEYTCNQSSGNCERYQIIDGTCRARPDACPIGTTCDTESGTCIKTELITELKQCSIGSDCFTPCTGISATCAAGLCEYSGSCTPVEIGCKQVGCAFGYKCNLERNVCERTIETTPAWVYLVAGVMIMLVIALIVIIARMRRR
jgi:hypothetical protein